MTSLPQVRQRAESDARTHGYYLNPDNSFLNDLLEGLKKNEERYGYPSCPCRLAAGKFELDRDIICPCDYRDPDVEEYGCCYCALYVSKDVYNVGKKGSPIPERRPIEKQNKAYKESSESLVESESKIISSVPAIKMDTKRKLWYCKQCGYICFREDPPYACPICKAKRELFSELSITVDTLG